MKNNLLCVKQNRWRDGEDYSVALVLCEQDPWVGSQKPLADERGHANFRSVSYGLRAGMIVLFRKWFAGKQTLRQIIGSWAPDDDTVGTLPGGLRNQPDLYAEWVCQRMGTVGTVDAGLRLFTDDGRIDRLTRLINLVWAIDEYETPAIDATVDEMLNGLQMFHLWLQTSRIDRKNPE